MAKATAHVTGALGVPWAQALLVEHLSLCSKKLSNICELIITFVVLSNTGIIAEATKRNYLLFGQLLWCRFPPRAMTPRIPLYHQMPTKMDHHRM